MVTRVLCVVSILAGCSSAPHRAAPPTPPPFTSDEPPSEPPGTPAPVVGDVELELVVIKTIYYRTDRTDEDLYAHDEYIGAAARCFDQIPLDERRPGELYEVRLQWLNPSYESPSAWEREGPSAFGDGMGNLPPIATDDRFTACVTDAIPHGEDLHDAKTSMVAIVVHAYTHSAVEAAR
jgi:hypothetical protein